MKDTWLSDEDIKKSLTYDLPSSCSLKSKRNIYFDVTAFRSFPNVALLRKHSEVLMTVTSYEEHFLHNTRSHLLTFCESEWSSVFTFSCYRAFICCMFYWTVEIFNIPRSSRLMKAQFLVENTVLEVIVL